MLQDESARSLMWGVLHVLINEHRGHEAVTEVNEARAKSQRPRVSC